MTTIFEGDKAITKFNIPGMKPDTRFKICEKYELHAHSALLKIHSEFFRKFFDSPEKIVPASNEFIYEWVSKYDDDGDWHVVVAQSTNPTSQLRKADHNEITAFKNMICAMYNEPYLIDKINELTRLTELAEYYLCRQSVSKSLDKALVGSDLGNYMLEYGSCETAELAVRLRHKGLLKASLIMMQDPWIEMLDSYHELRNEKVKQAAFKLSGRLQASIGRTTLHFLNELRLMERWNPQVYQEMSEFMQEAVAESSITVENPEGADFSHAAKYFRLLESFITTDGSQPFQPSIHCSGLTNNDMELFPVFTSGGPGYENKFFCGEMPDEDLPWDTNDLDW